MALYSFSHAKISVSETGKTFARLAYVCRQGADVLGERHGLAEYDRASLRGFARTREAMPARMVGWRSASSLLCPAKARRQTIAGSCAPSPNG